MSSVTHTYGDYCEACGHVPCRETIWVPPQSGPHRELCDHVGAEIVASSVACDPFEANVCTRCGLVVDKVAFPVTIRGKEGLDAS